MTGGSATGQDTSGTSGGTLDVKFASIAVGATVTVTYTAAVPSTVTPNQSLDSTAKVIWTSLPGSNGTTSNPTGSANTGLLGSATGERTGSGISPNTYDATKNAPFTVLAPPALVKNVVSTSLAQTSGSNLAIGEQVTYDVTFTLSEATYASLTLTDALPAGLTYVSSQVVSVGASISSSALASGRRRDVLGR